MNNSIGTHLHRRTVLTAGAATVLSGAPASATVSSGVGSRTASVRDLEKTYEIRIGLAAVNLRTGRSLSHRSAQRFPLLSTFKTLAAAAVLRSDIDLDRTVRYPGSAVVENSPVTSQRRRMSIAELIDAALRYSDNTAGNLLLRQIGGPPAVTRFARSLGDEDTRLDRWEPRLNTAIPHDRRDTTTPASILATYRRLLLGPVLPADRRWLLRGVMQGNTTSVGRFRAALPTGWWFADKTGGGAYATQNDVGLLTAPDGTQIAVAVLTWSDRADAVAAPQLMTDVARIVIDL